VVRKDTTYPVMLFITTSTNDEVSAENRASRSKDVDAGILNLVKTRRISGATACVNVYSVGLSSYPFELSLSKDKSPLYINHEYIRAIIAGTAKNAQMSSQLTWRVDCKKVPIVWIESLVMHA